MMDANDDWLESSSVTFKSFINELQLEDPHYTKGGDLGIFNKLSNIFGLPYSDDAAGVKAFDDCLGVAPVGEIEIVTTSFGTHLVKVEARN